MLATLLKPAEWDKQGFFWHIDHNRGAVTQY